MKKKFNSIEDGIKNALKDLSEDEILYATKKYAGIAKKKDYFYKCSEGKGHNIHHKYSIALDIACINKDKGPSMLKAHEAMIARYFEKTPNTTTAELTLYLGQVMEDVGRLTGTVVSGLEDGTLTQAEQKEIKDAIKKTEESIVKLKRRIGEEVED